MNCRNFPFSFNKMEKKICCDKMSTEKCSSLCLEWVCENRATYNTWFISLPAWQQHGRHNLRTEIIAFGCRMGTKLSDYSVCVRVCVFNLKMKERVDLYCRFCVVTGIFCSRNVSILIRKINDREKRKAKAYARSHSHSHVLNRTINGKASNETRSIHFELSLVQQSYIFQAMLLNFLLKVTVLWLRSEKF